MQQELSQQSPATELSAREKDIPREPSRRLSWPARLALVFLFGAGAALRFVNLFWDNGLSYHPDEMNIAIAVSKLSFANGALHPDFFAYNGLVLYFYRLVVEALAFLSGTLSWTTDLGSITLAGRYVSATLSTLSLPLFYALGKTIEGPRTGFFAFALASLCGGLIQTAHYSVTETMLLFFVLLMAVCAGRAVVSGRSPGWEWALLGVFGGLALGAKTTAALFVVFPAVVFVGRLRTGDRGLALGGLLLCGWIWATTAFSVSPWSLLDLQGFLGSMRYEGGVAQGTVDVPYTLQFVGSTPWLFPLLNLPWHLGPIIPPLGILGVGALLVSMLRGRSTFAALPLLVFGLVFFGIVGSWHAKFIRNLFPMYPALIVPAAWILGRIVAAGERSGFLARTTLGFTSLVVIVPSLLWGLAVGNIFFEEHTRTAASRWIYANVPAGATLVVETWDYRLPASIGGEPGRYQYSTVAAPDPDSDAKLQALAQTLASGDYVVLASRRNWGNLPKLPERFPVMSSYYDRLFAEKLGYRKAATFRALPGIPPITSLPGLPNVHFPGIYIDDRDAEETFSVFDHPTVMIYKNEERLDATKIAELLKETKP